MKTLKNIIKEVRLLSDYSKNKYPSEPIGPIKSWNTRKWAHPVHISTMPSGHKIWKTSKDENEAVYTATDANNNKHVSVSCSEHKLKTGITKLEDLDLKSHEGNTLKAHDFYHHLITNHNIMLVGTIQSKGGRHVWKQLHKRSREKGSNIGVHGWTHAPMGDKDGKAVPLAGQPTHVSDMKLRNLTWKGYKLRGSYVNHAGNDSMPVDDDIVKNIDKARSAISSVGRMHLIAGPRKLKTGITSAADIKSKRTIDAEDPKDGDAAAFRNLTTQRRPNIRDIPIAIARQRRNNPISEAVLNRILHWKNPPLHIDQVVSHYKENLKKKIRKMSTTPEGYTLYHVKLEKGKNHDGQSYDKIYAVDHKGMVHLSVKGYSRKNKNGTITMDNLDLASHEGNEMKAHEFYHHLITHHNYILHSDNQSKGAVKVWKHLGKKPGVRIHGWNPDKKAGVGLSGQPTHVHADKMYSSEYFSNPGVRSVTRMSMVAGPTKIRKQQ